MITQPAVETCVAADPAVCDTHARPVTRSTLYPVTITRRFVRRLRCPKGKGKGSPYSITERRVPELIPVLGSQPAGDVSHNPGGRLPLLSARPAVTPGILKRAATSFAAW